MESRNGGASSEGILIPVCESSELFQTSILAPLQSAYLYEESKHFFRYKSAVLVKNPDLEEKYHAFRAGKRTAGYSEEDLQETFGFLLFDDGSKANAVGKSGVISGNGSCTTLGDPAKGVYISMFSDCLDLNRWYHGKSGYIAIIKLTKGKVKNVAENYTQNFTEPSVGFDCHVSDQLPSVSAKTSSFLAFERTQFYIYELLNDGSGGTSRCPSAACPFAIVSFSYMDTKASHIPQEKSELKKQVCHYLTWRGQLQIESQFYHVDLRSNVMAFIPAQLPPVIKVNQAISMSDLRILLPRAAFETSFTEEVFLEGFYCDLCEFVSSEAKEANSFALLLSKMKEKDLALCIPLHDGGFLILMHSSHFLRYDDAESTSAEVMNGLFVFPDSRVVRRDTKFRGKSTSLSNEILGVLPVLSYAEGEAEKACLGPNDELCEVFAQHMQSYATLINPGFSLSSSRPSRELSIFPDQYDVADAHKHLYSSPEWNDRTWQTFKSYLNKPASFQLPIAKVSEILASGQEERREDLDDCVYICLSSPEAVPTSPVSMEAQDHFSDEQSQDDIKTSMDVDLPSTELQVAPTQFSRMSDILQSENGTKDYIKCTSVTEQMDKSDDPKAQDPLSPSTTEDLPAELIVSLTSAEPSVPDKDSEAKHTDFHFSGLSTITKLQTAEVNSAIEESDKTKNCLDLSMVTKHQTSTKRRRRRRRRGLTKKKVHKTSVKTESLNTVVSSVEVEHLNHKTEEQNEQLNLPQLSPTKPKWKRPYKRKRVFGTLSSKNKKLKSAKVQSAKDAKKILDAGPESLKSPIILGLQALPLRKKTVRWDIKPVTSECGRILHPFGSVDFVNQMKSMQCAAKDKCLDKLSNDIPVMVPDSAVMNKQLGTASLMATDISTPTSDDGGQIPLPPTTCTASPRNADTNSLSSTTVESKLPGNISPTKIFAKGDLLLSKLKSVLSSRKRELGLIRERQKTECVDQESEPCLKKTKVDSDKETIEDNITPQSDSVSKMASVDPGFAYYLGLTPKENVKNEKAEHTFLEKQQQIIQKPPSFIPTRGRIKTLKRLQGISAETVKKKCTPFQVPPLSGSTRLLNHHHTKYGDGLKTLHVPVNMEDTGENIKTSEYLSKQKERFKTSRTFVMKENTIQVTRKWQENYNFNLDSRFTSDPKDKAVIRALHGPWDFFIQDTTEEVRLIFHMWIGLFYSRSTERFFQVDPSFMPPCSEKSGPLKITSGTSLGQTQPEPEINSIATLAETPNQGVSEMLDLSKPESSDSVTESEILDLSVKKLEAKPVPWSNLQPAADQQEKETIQLNKVMPLVGEISGDKKNVEMKCEATETQEKSLLSDHDKKPKSDETFVSLEPEPDRATFGIGPVSYESNKDVVSEKNGIENREATVKCLHKEDELCSPTPALDKKENSNTGDSNVMGTDVCADVKLKAKESCQKGNYPCQDGNETPLDMINTCDTNVNEELDTVCNGDVKEKQSSEQSLEKADSLGENMDFCTKLTTEELDNEDKCLRKDGDNEEESCSSAADIDRDLRNPLLPKLCDGFIQQGYISEISRIQMDERLPSSDSTGEAPLSGNPTVLEDESPTLDTPSEPAPKFQDTTLQDISKRDCQKLVLPISNESSLSFKDSFTIPCLPQEKDGIESKNKASDLNSCTSSNECKSQESNLACKEGNISNALLELQVSQSKPEIKDVSKVDGEQTENTYSIEETNDLSKSLNLCITKDGAGLNVSPQDVVEEIEDQEPIPLISTVSISAADMNGFYRRSPTPTIDENPHEIGFFSNPSSSTGVTSDGEDNHNIIGNSKSSMEEMALEEKLQASAGDTNPKTSAHLSSDVKKRTLRVLKSINEFLSTSNHVNSKKSVAPSLGSRNKQIKDKKTKLGSTCILQTQTKKQSDLHKTFVKSKSKDVPGLKRPQLKKHFSTSSDRFKIADEKTQIGPDFHLEKASISKGLRKEKMKSQSNSSSSSKHPAIAVKPAKNEEHLQHWLSKGMNIKTTSQSKQASDCVTTYLLAPSMILMETETFKQNLDGVVSKSVHESYSKTTWLENSSCSKSNIDGTFAPLDPHHHSRTFSKLHPISSPSDVLCNKSGKTLTQGLGNGHIVNGTGEDVIELVNRGESSNKPLTRDKNDALSEDDHSSLTSVQCTIFNSGEKGASSFIEQISQRCLQNDLTQASMEQECLIYSEQMKNLIKNKKETLCQLDTNNTSTSCTSPLTVSFSNLEELDDSMEDLDTPFVKQKIKVDISDTKNRRASKEEGKAVCSPSRELSNPMEHVGVSTMTAECARLYEAKMQDVCSAKKVPLRLKSKKGHQGDTRTDSSNHFDFCDQMKRDLDDTFRSNLNAVVKKSCKTKYRFYILVTSDDVFFEETRDQLEAEGHSAVQPSEFFLEDSSSSLLIILRNEDIADHICKVPHLLKLKLTPGVLFAGIDEPDDVINLTHQELFTRAGFVMVDRAVLEPLSICNMKEISKNLQELSKTGKWKWMLHYRDSRRLKENARMSEEANMKKLFMYWCQDAGILEVLPYHECDQMTKDQPDYLACLRRLQVQHISSRLTVFITDATTDGAFEENGILTMTLNAFLTKSPSEILSQN
ncbi:PREDICTED: protein FAM208B isoform X2 [Cyprinodon variegatus]|uniref:protein FAM208B isoform X2 n=1 Tax=Cyprinodon variegatus TaxID=28743 RepID=UPI000742BE2B|nr:PREDICTED: protein FAM208B isoform X2 [Cyprinodon variegatus]